MSIWEKFFGKKEETPPTEVSPEFTTPEAMKKRQEEMERLKKGKEPLSQEAQEAYRKKLEEGDPNVTEKLKEMKG